MVDSSVWSQVDSFLVAHVTVADITWTYLFVVWLLEFYFTRTHNSVYSNDILDKKKEKRNERKSINTYIHTIT